MRRALGTLLLTAAMTLGVLPVAAAAPDSPRAPSVPPQLSRTAAEPERAVGAAVGTPDAALETAEQVLTGQAPAGAPDASVALMELLGSLHELSGAKRAEALALLTPPRLSRSTNDTARRRAGARVAGRRVCNDLVCVHWTASPTSEDHATNAFAQQALVQATRVYQHHVEQLGYRRPLSDHGWGGTPQFDVVLRNTGAVQIYGYCAAIGRLANQRSRTAPGYCVLDNDFAEFASTARGRRDVMRVTAAHELFHAVQLAYDYGEDPWFKESTATWVEERYADRVDDNRQYLRFGQVRQPHRPLDHNENLSIYGNWAFFEFLSEKFSSAIVRRIWTRAASPRLYSVAAIERELRRRGTFARRYAEFGGVNTAPGSYYPEGAAWPRATIAGRRRVTRWRPRARFSPRVRHLTTRSLAIDVKRQGLRRSGAWRLQVHINGPARRTGSGAHLLIHLRNGRVETRSLWLNRRGDRTVNVRLRRGAVRRVTVTVANASERFRHCHSRTGWSCAKKPTNPRSRFVVTARIRR